MLLLKIKIQILGAKSTVDAVMLLESHFIFRVIKKRIKGGSDVTLTLMEPSLAFTSMSWEFSLSHSKVCDFQYIL